MKLPPVCFLHVSFTCALPFSCATPPQVCFVLCGSSRRLQCTHLVGVCTLEQKWQRTIPWCIITVGPHPTPPHPTPRCRASARCVMSGFCSLCDVGGPSGNKGLRTQLCGWGWGWGRGWGELKPTWVLGANMCVCVFHYQAWFSHLLEHKSAPDCTNQPKRIHESPNLNKSKEI